MIYLSIPKNIDRFSAMSVDIIFGVPIVMFYFKELYFLLALFGGYFVYDVVTQAKFYITLFKDNVDAKKFLIIKLLLFSLNSFVVVLFYLLEEDIYKYMAWLSISYSVWFGYYEANRCYLRNKELIDEYFSDLLRVKGINK